MMKKRPEKNYTQDHIHVVDVVNGVVVTEDERYVRILEITPINFAMKRPEEQQAILDGWRKWLKTSPVRFSFKFTTKQTPTDKYTSAFTKAKASESDEKIHDAIEDHCRFVKRLGSGHSIEHKFYIIFEYEKTAYSYEENEEEIMSALLEQERVICAGLEALGNTIITYENPDRDVCEFLYNHYNRKLVGKEPFDERLKRYEHDVRFLNNAYGRDDMKNVYIKDILAPRSINTADSPEYVLIDGLYYSYLYVKANEYPGTMSTNGWLSKLINTGYGIEVDIFFEKKDVGEVLSKMRRKTRLTRLKMKDRQADSADMEEIEGSYNAMTYSRNRIKEYGDDLYDMYILITVCAYTKKDLYLKKNDLINQAKREGYGIGEFKRNQLEGFYSTEPLNRLTKKAAALAKHNVLTEVIQAAYMFTTFALNDPEGILIGQHQYNGSLAIYDQFDTGKYPNANMTIFGGSGRGKTFSLLTVTTRLRYKGVRNFILAPDKQDEFRRTCSELNGEFVDISTSAKTRVNPFDIWPITSKTDLLINDKKGDETSWLINKITALDQWVNMLIQGLTQEDRTRIRNCMYNMYAGKGITERNDSLYVDGQSLVLKEMPIYSDFVNELKKDPLIPKYITAVFEQFTTGIYKNLNGPTNVDLENKYIVFGLEHLSGELKAPMMYIILDYVWSVTKSDKTQNKVIVIDEGSVLVNGDDPQVGKFVVEIFRMIRGFGGAAIFATQTISDLYKNGGEFGNTILSNAHSHMLMGMEATDVGFIKKTLNISEKEASMLCSFGNQQKGACILCAGAVHIPIYVRASEKEKYMFDTSAKGLRKIAEQKENQI